MTVCPFATWRPVAKHGGRMSAHLGLILHVQAGNNGLSGWFSNPTAPDASSTWWVAKDGRLEQYVDAELAAWAQGTGNTTYNSVETEGYPTEALTPAAEATLARLYAWGHQTYRWPLHLADHPGASGFGWHGMGGAAWGGHTGCPGDLRKNRRAAILARVGGTGASPPPPPVAPPAGPAAAAPPLHVDYFGRRHHNTHPDVAVWQQKMAARGWTITVDGDFGPASERVCATFQAEKHLAADGLVGPQTWAATWTAPVT